MLEKLNTLKNASDSRRMLIILMMRDKIVRKAYHNMHELFLRKQTAQRKLFAMFMFSMRMKVQLKKWGHDMPQRTRRYMRKAIIAGAASMERVQRKRAAGVLKSFFYHSSEKYEVLSTFNNFFRRIVKV